eukprot:633430-Amphidinium_carterae.1
MLAKVCPHEPIHSLFATLGVELELQTLQSCGIKARRPAIRVNLSISKQARSTTDTVQKNTGIASSHKRVTSEAGHHKTSTLLARHSCTHP